MHPSVKNLESVVKRVRDVLRKGDGITDMDSMAHCVLFTAARMLDTATATKLNVPYTWDSVISKVLAKDISGADKAFKDILEVLDSKFSTNEFTWKLKVQDDFEKIVKLFNELDIHEVAKQTDVLGFIYEQHISTGSGGGRDLGKFYTDRQITRYLTELLGSDITAGRPDSMCDATMGTGGFILSYIEYVTKMCPEVKWDDYDLAGGDIDDKVAAIARLNVFLRTGKLFPMIRKRNTLKNDIGDSSDKRKTFKRLLMNIPFGVKGLTLADDCCERIKEIVKVGTKSEPLFMTLTCQLLAEGGKAAVIVPDGVLDNCSKQHDIFRKYLLENFKVLRIIKMRGKFFMNTGIQPSVIVFERSGKTDVVEFWDVEKVASGELVETCMLKVERERFDGSCSFDMRRYQEVKAVANPAGFPMVKLMEVIESKNGKNIPQEKRSVKGTYPYYASNGISGFVEQFIFEGPAVLLGDQGSCWMKSTQYVEDGVKFYAGNHTLVMKSKCARINIKYLYYYCKLTDIIQFSRPAALIPELDKGRFIESQFPLPPLAIQQEIVESLDLIYNNANTAKLAAASIKSQMAAIMRSVGARGYEKKKLGDFSSMIKGNAFKSEEFLTSGFPILKVSDLENRCINTSNLVYTTQNSNYNKFLVIKNDILLVVTGSSTGKLAMNTSKMEFYLNQNSVVLRADPSVVEQKFLFHLLLSDEFQKCITNASSGSAQPFVSCKNINEMEIPIPPLPIQQEVLAILNEMEAELKVMEQMAAKAEQRAKYVLDGYLSSQPVEGAVQEVLEPDVAPQNTLVSVSESEPAEAPTPSPKPAKRIIKLKKGPAPPKHSE